MYTRSLGRLLLPIAICTLVLSAVQAQQPLKLFEQTSLIYKIQSPSERLEMTVKTSRILTMDQKIPQAQVNNPDIMELTPLSPTQIQASAKAPGVTQINVWGEDEKLYTVDVIVRPDARELELILHSAFPHAALKVVPVSSAVMISGFVDKPEHVDRVIRIAEEYYPKVINNMSVGGCQQVLLHVKVMEVSRTKLRQLGFDWGKITGSSTIMSGPNSLLTDHTNEFLSPPGTIWRAAKDSSFAFGVVNGTSAFYGVLDALRQDNLMKIMSEPTLVTVSGRAASFNSGGEIPVPEPQSLGTISIAWKKYGTQVDFVPIVLGNGKIRLEVRPRISELDYTNGTTIGGSEVPGIKMRETDTGVELMAGETLAIAGLVQTTVEAENKGLPWISELPYLGMAFRNVKEERNEVELLILVTPELVEAMSADEAPQCGPGMQTTSPSDWELFMKGYLEVPNCCPATGCGNGQCQECGENSDSMPPDGMILESGAGSASGAHEPIPAPQPTEDGTDSASGVRRPYNRHISSNPHPSPASSSVDARNGPPGFIGPMGYDVVK